MAPQVVRFTINLDDVVDSQSFAQRPLMLMATAIGFGALAVGSVLLVGGSVGLGIGLVAYGLLDLALVRARPIRRWLAARRARHLVGTEFAFELDPANGLRWTESDGGGTLGWSSLSDVREDGRLLAFMAGGVVRATIPKRAFRSSDESARFRDAARQLVKSGAG